MSIGKRLWEVRKFLEMSQTSFASILETDQNKVSLMENGRLAPKDEFLENIISKLHINRTWLMTGDGEMFTIDRIPESHLTKEQLDKVVEHTWYSETAIPFYDKPIEGFSDEDTEETPKYMIDFRPFNDCTFYRPVYGDSMIPKFRRGDILACKRISDKDPLIYGETYICSFIQDGRTIELLRTIRRNEDPGTISLVPLNPEYDPIIIPVTSIEALYIIKGRIERFF